SGITTVAAVNGIATFSNLSIDKAGTGYTLAASSSGLAGAASGAFSITAGAATHLAFLQQPSTPIDSQAVSPAFAAQVLDADNIPVSSTSTLTPALVSNPPLFRPSGITTVAAVSGVATFSNLSINKAGTGYTLAASSGTLAGATSGAFSIVVGAATHLAF